MLVKFFAQLLLTFCYFVFLAFIVFFLLLPLGEIKMCVTSVLFAVIKLCWWFLVKSVSSIWSNRLQLNPEKTKLLWCASSRRHAAPITYRYSDNYCYLCYKLKQLIQTWIDNDNYDNNNHNNYRIIISGQESEVGREIEGSGGRKSPETERTRHKYCARECMLPLLFFIILSRL